MIWPAQSLDLNITVFYVRHIIKLKLQSETEMDKHKQSC